VEDPEGHRWLFASHVRDVDPGDWGATVAKPLGKPLNREADE
jgi:hypothetical protein